MVTAQKASDHARGVSIGKEIACAKRSLRRPGRTKKADGACWRVKSPGTM